MDKNSAAQLIKKAFQNPFDKERFIFFVRNLLNHFTEAPFIYRGNFIPDAYDSYIKTLERIGKYEDPEGNKIDILIANLKKEKSLEHARTMQRNFIAWYLNGSRGGIQKDAALVAFVSPNKKDWRFSLVKMEYKLIKTQRGRIKAKEELTPAKRFSFLVGINESSHTAQSQLVSILEDDVNNPTLEQLEESFNIEKVTKEFFEKYHELFLELKKSLDKIRNENEKIRVDFEAKNINTVDFAKKLLGQIVFLYFLQKKGWFGVKKNEEWGSGSKNFLRELFDKKHSNYKNFFNDILEPLFYEALRNDRSHEDHYFSYFNCKIPFLNGGLFDPLNGYDWKGADIELPNELFSNTHKTKEGDIGNGILDIFDRYNFTVKEDEPLEKEVAVDPEMLGKVFENLLEVKDRKSKGTYYTPREIVHYMCQQSLINYLDTELNNNAATFEKIGERQSNMFGNKGKRGQLDLTIEHGSNLKVPKEDIETLIKYGEIVIEHETEVKSRGKETKTYSYTLPKSVRDNAELIDDKLKTIRICDPAVGSGAFPVGMMNEIIRTRNALTPYLSLRGAEATKQSRTPYNFKRHAIQNSLYGVDIDLGAVEIAKLRLWLSLIVDEEDIKQIKPLPNLDYKIVQGNSLLGFPYTPQGLEKIEQLKQKFFGETRPKVKERLRKEIDESIVKLFANTEKSLGYKVNFDFKIFFSEVFHEKKGFDVVIANPPYNAKLTDNEKKKYKAVYESVKTGRQDTAAIFVELAKRIGNSQMELSYILPYRLFSRKRNHGQFQIYTLHNYSIRKILYLGADIGFSASDEFMILLMTTKNIKVNKIRVSFKPDITNFDHAIFSGIEQNKFIERSEINLNLLKFDPVLISKIEKETITLVSSTHFLDRLSLRDFPIN